MHETADGDRGGEPLPQPIRAAAAYGGSTSGLIADARDLVRGVLVHTRSQRGTVVPEHVIASAQIVVSELVTNAFKYAHGTCQLRLEARADVLEVAVWDDSPAKPVARSPDPGRVGQHGLEIVKALCHSVEISSAAAGKWVTAVLALTG
ncbi:ATP-binding protein [Streptomyces sp. NPDC046831]|uniref:ATP-binding protein n=1 Tax=Streptomyces sp. NPDC046831 TaxID=3154805 RepID=UPI0033DA5FC9